jgi:membrane protease YdiL (CAAX protease family)
VLVRAELAVTFGNPVLVFPLHGGLAVGIVTYLAWIEQHRDKAEPTPAIVALLLVLLISPLIRLISLTLPLSQIEAPYRYLFAGIPMTLAAVLVARATGLRRTEIGLVWRRWRWQVAVIVGSVGLGLLEFVILRPTPLGGLPWAGSLVPALAVAVFTGFPEELIFRGLMQTAARPLIGSWNWLYVSAVFAALHIGYQSFVDLAFVFGVGVLYGLVFEKTRSIIGTSIGHGIANAVLFFVAPYLLLLPATPLP